MDFKYNNSGFYKKGPYILYILLVSFLYLPHFILISGLPQVLNDSFAYFLEAKDIYEGNLPLKGYYMDLPPGYPLFMGLVYKLGGNIQTVVLLQTTIFVSSFLTLIHFFSKQSTIAGFIASLLCFCYVSTSDSLMWSSLIYTESLYIASLVLFVFGLLVYLDSGTRKGMLILLLSTLGASVFRSNGIFLFSILLLLIVLTFFQKRKKESFFLVKGVLIIVLTSCSINFFIKGSFLPFETVRAFERMGLIKLEVIHKEKVVLIDKKDKYAGTFYEQTCKILTHGSRADFGNHYYFRMPRQIKYFLRGGRENDVYNGQYLSAYKKLDDSEPKTILNFITKGLSFNQAEISNLLEITDVNKRPRNTWVYLCHIIHLSSIIFRNTFILLIFFGCLVWTGFLAFKAKFNLKNHFVKCGILSLTHLGSIGLLILLVPRDTSLSRYTITTEFIILLMPVYLLLPFINKKNRRCLTGNQ